MLHPSTYVGTSLVGGRGIFAARGLPLGTIVWHPCKECERVLANRFVCLSQQEQADLVEFGYKLRDGSHLMPCRDARLLNHSCDPNVLDVGADFGIAVRNISLHEEITIDYRTFASDADWKFDCRCISPMCIGRVTQLAPDRDSVLKQQLVQRAMTRVIGVDQALHSSLMKSSRTYRGLLEGSGELPKAASIRSPSFLAAAVD